MSEGGVAFRVENPLGVKPGKEERKESTALEEQNTEARMESRPEWGTWGTLESFDREQIQRWLQELLEEEVTELLGHEKSVRRSLVDAPAALRLEDTIKQACSALSRNLSRDEWNEYVPDTAYRLTCPNLP